jgi:hypothetical protein
MCDIANGRVEPCKNSVGGLDAIYFINYKIKDTDVTYTASTDEKVIIPLKKLSKLQEKMELLILSKYYQLN